MPDLAQLALHSRVIVDLGMGDGRLLESLAQRDSDSLYIGIELNSEQCDQARSRISLGNVVLLNGSFEEIVLALPDASVDRFIAVLPDPAYIDEKKEQVWRPFYEIVYSKLKKSGSLQLVTEITDELLQPVSDGEYARWSEWLRKSFLSMGFALAGQHEGAPQEYSTRCLDQFRGDPERIRITNLNLVKP